MTKKLKKNKKKDVKIRTRVSCVECSECRDLIYSRARHDFHWCTCGSTFVDGGFDYLRTGGNCTEVTFIKYVNATKDTIYQDWNMQVNEFGIIGKKFWKTKGLKI